MGLADRIRKRSTKDFAFMKKSLKIATFNVNGIHSRLPHLLEWLRREARQG